MIYQLCQEIPPLDETGLLLTTAELETCCKHGEDELRAQNLKVQKEDEASMAVLQDVLPPSASHNRVSTTFSVTSTEAILRSTPQERATVMLVRFHNRQFSQLAVVVDLICWSSHGRSSDHECGDLDSHTSKT